MGMTAAIQDALVAVIALGAAAVLLRRVFGFVGTDTTAQCAHCSTPPPAQANVPATHAPVMPLRLIRKTDAGTYTTQTPMKASGPSGS